MGNIFDIAHLKGVFANGQDKAIAAAGAYGLNALLVDRVLPPLPPFPRPQTIRIEEASYPNGEVDGEVATIESPDYFQAEVSMFGTPMCFPLSVKLKSEKDWWLIPVEPIITLGGSNTIAKRKIAKGKLRGTIKERWSQEDYSISIEGILTRLDEWNYPTDDVGRMRSICEAKEPIDVKCQLFEIFGISQMVIEIFYFPFTKGEENQAYRISALSDDDVELLIPRKKNLNAL